LSDAGVKGYDMSPWIGVFAPAGTPKAIVDKLHADLKSIVATPETQKKLVELGVIPIDTPPVAELQAYVKSEIGRWGKVVEQAGIAGSE
jgi:tripartite-type tricarboxylate transporter receptor subunit TctC